MRPPELTWEYTGIRVRKLGRSIRFYRRLGFREIGRGRMEHGGRFVALRVPGSKHQLELNFYPTGNRFYTPWSVGTEFDHFGIVVPDIEGWSSYIRRLRLPVTADWSERGLRLIYIRDPDGNWIEISGKVSTGRHRPGTRKARPS